jgi:hypothetical protein
MGRCWIKGYEVPCKVKTASMDDKTAPMDDKTATMDDKTASTFDKTKAMIGVFK